MIKIITIFLTVKQATKRSLLLPLVMICFSPAQSQLKSELNLPRTGDKLVKEQVVYFEPGEAGENQTWDFSRLRLIDDACTVHYFTRDDWKIIGAESGKLSFLQIDGDSLLLAGYENPNTLVRYQQPGLLMRFPIEYGAGSNGQFAGRGKHHDLLESAVTGEIRTLADATGSLILPGNDTLSSVVRVHIRKTETARYIPISSGFAFDCPAIDSLFSGCVPETVTTDTYQWYEEGYRYPVFETIETCRNGLPERTVLSRDAYFYHPGEQAYLPEDTANRAALERKQAARNARMLEKEGSLLSFGCYPNPVKDRLTVELTLRQAANVEAGLRDMNGRLILRFPSRTNITHFRETLDVQTLPPGYYLVKVTAGNETASEKIVKN